MGHEVRTVPEMGWASKKNGELLELAAEQFDVFLTVDRNLSYQQDLAQLKLAVVVLVSGGNRLADLRPLMPTVLDLLPAIVAGQLIKVGG